MLCRAVRTPRKETFISASVFIKNNKWLLHNIAKKLIFIYGNTLKNIIVQTKNGKYLIIFQCCHLHKNIAYGNKYLENIYIA